ncbi:MAG: hypothetical protein R3F40_15965 [Candidatus Competibacteraceae bacterium]
MRKSGRARRSFSQRASRRTGKRALSPHTIGVPVRLSQDDCSISCTFTARDATVVVVPGIAEPDKGRLSVVRALLEHCVGKLEISTSSGLTLAETIAAVGDLSSDAMVLC